VQYAPSHDRNGHELHPGDKVRFKTYPRGTAEGVVVISKRFHEVLPDGKTAPALAIDSDGTTYNMPPPKGVLKIGASLNERVVARYWRMIASKPPMSQ
jgi:hypothetical protein